MAAACSDDEEVRPPPPPDCNQDPVCLEAQANALPGSVGAGLPTNGNGNGGGAGGAGGGSGMPGAGIVLAGNVREVTQLDPVQRGGAVGLLEVRAPSAAEGADPVSDEMDASGAYRLEEVEQSLPVWVGVGTFDGLNVDSFYMDTLQALDPSVSPDDVVVVPRISVQELVSAAFTATPLEVNPAAAQIFVRFVEPDGTPIPGVEVVNPPVTDTSRIAYDSGPGEYSDSFLATEERGVAVIANYAAVPYPGATLELIARLGEDEYAVDVQVAANSISVVTAIIEVEP